MPNTIMLQAGPGTKYEERIAQAASAIKPGHTVVLDGVTVNRCKVGPVNGGNLEIAMEDGLQAKTVNDTYSPGDVVFTAYPAVGDVFMARMVAATYTQGQPLATAASGQLKAVATPATDLILAVAEPLDANGYPALSAVVAADGLLRCRRT